MVSPESGYTMHVSGSQVSPMAQRLFAGLDL